MKILIYFGGWLVVPLLTGCSSRIDISDSEASASLLVSYVSGILKIANESADYRNLESLMKSVVSTPIAKSKEKALKPALISALLGPGLLIPRMEQLISGLYLVVAVPKLIPGTSSEVLDKELDVVVASSSSDMSPEVTHIQTLFEEMLTKIGTANNNQMKLSLYFAYCMVRMSVVTSLTNSEQKSNVTKKFVSLHNQVMAEFDREKSGHIIDLFTQAAQHPNFLSSSDHAHVSSHQKKISVGTSPEHEMTEEKDRSPLVLSHQNQLSVETAPEHAMSEERVRAISQQLYDYVSSEFGVTSQKTKDVIHMGLALATHSDSSLLDEFSKSLKEIGNMDKIISALLVSSIQKQIPNTNSEAVHSEIVRILRDSSESSHEVVEAKNAFKEMITKLSDDEAKFILLIGYSRHRMFLETNLTTTQQKEYTTRQFSELRDSVLKIEDDAERKKHVQEFAAFTKQASYFRNLFAIRPESIESNQI